jgi:PHP family Zn ribbon phosphoesterase
MSEFYTCNLHVHTCLSPCGDLDMHPRAIVQEALAQQLDIIAICDHNTAENVKYVIKAAQGTELVVIPGMEVTTREEVHILSLFGNLDALSLLQDYVYSNLDGLNDEDVFGMQVVVNEIGEVEGFNERLLIGATKIAIEDLVEKIHSLGGLAIAAHIDRPSFSVISQLGFIPAYIPFDALEISANLSIEEARRQFSGLEQYPFITSSDAHYMKDLFGAVTKMFLEEASFSEIHMALRKEEGRYVGE